MNNTTTTFDERLSALVREAMDSSDNYFKGVFMPNRATVKVIELLNEKLIVNNLLAADLSTKYDLSKLESDIEQLRKAWETKDGDDLINCVNDFLRSITRESKPQP